MPGKRREIRQVDGEILKTLALLDQAGKQQPAPGFYGRLSARLHPGAKPGHRAPAHSNWPVWLGALIPSVAVSLGVVAGIFIGSQWVEPDPARTADELTETYALAVPDIEGYMLSGQENE